MASALTARRKGTNEGVSTYGNGTRQHTSMGTWEADWDIDCVAGQVSPVLECYNDAVFDDTIIMAGAITSADYPRILRPAGVRGEASWQGHDGTPNTGVRFLNTTNSSPFAVNESHGSIYDITIVGTFNTTGSIQAVGVNSGDGSRLVGVMASRTTLGTSGQGFRVEAAATNTVLADCLSFNNTAQAYTIVNNAVLYNCVAVGSKPGFASFAAPIAKNCLSNGNTTADFSGTFAAASTNNASSDATAPGANFRRNQTFAFVNPAGNDYHLAPADTGALGFGTDLSGDATFPFDDDIDGERITTWSIGFDAPTPTAPTTLAAVAAGADAISLAWDAHADAASFSVFRSLVPGGPYTSIATGVLVPSYEDTGLDAGTTYYYVVTAVDGQESLNSAEANATTEAAPASSSGGSSAAIYRRRRR